MSTPQPINRDTPTLESVLREAQDYIANVNADWPKGQDEDRDELVAKIDEVLKGKP